MLLLVNIYCHGDIQLVFYPKGIYVFLTITDTPHAIRTFYNVESLSMRLFYQVLLPVLFLQCAPPIYPAIPHLLIMNMMVNTKALVIVNVLSCRFERD